MSAIGGIGLTTAQSYLKDYYLPNGFWQQLTNDSQMLSDIRGMGETIAIYGETSGFMVENSRNSGIKYSHETADLPEVGVRKGVQGHIVPKQIYGRTSLDEFTIAITKHNQGAFLSALGSRFMTLIEDFGNALQLSIMTDTYGQLAKVVGAVSTADNAVVDAVWRFEPGIKIKVYSQVAGKPNGASKATLIVSDVDHDNDTVYFETSFSCADGDVLCFNAEDATGLDVEGIEGHFKTPTEKATLHNINRTETGKRFYAHTRIKNGDAEALLDENVLRKATSRSAQLAPKKRSFINKRFYGGVYEIDGYESTQLDFKRFPSVGNAPQYDTGKPVEGLYFDQHLMHKDKYYTPKTVGLFSMGSWNVHIVEEENFMDRDGNMLHRIANKPGYEGTEYMFWNVSNKNPRENIEITNVQAFDASA